MVGCDCIGVGGLRFGFVENEDAARSVWLRTASVVCLKLMKRVNAPPGRSVQTTPPNQCSRGSVHVLHELLGHPAAVNFDFDEGCFEVLKIRRGEFDVKGAEVLGEVIGVACAGDRDDPRLLRQQPREGDLRGCRVLLSRESASAVPRPACSPRGFPG